MDTMPFDGFQIAGLGNDHGILIVRTSRRDVLDLDGGLLWAGSFRLVGGFDWLHDLHVRLDG